MVKEVQEQMLADASWWKYLDEAESMNFENGGI